MAWCPLLLLFVASSLAFESFQARIPNGALVQAVGHLSHDGGGSLGSFGRDFDKEGAEWTKTLCEKDSDGDGISNGAELGDPCCTWEEGKEAMRTDMLSHPGEARDKFEVTVDCKEWRRTHMTALGGGSGWSFGHVTIFLFIIAVVAFGSWRVQTNQKSSSRHHRRTSLV
jgi:hypothetical protein